jgi:hypothetical protein
MQLRSNLYRGVGADILSTKRYQTRKGNQLRVPRSAYHGQSRDNIEIILRVILVSVR